MTHTGNDEVADRLALRGLIDAWAHCADRRLPQQQADLFIPEGAIGVYAGDPTINEPLQQLQGRAELAEAFKVLDGYDSTFHFTGQSVITLDGDRASGETYCLAHHLWSENGDRWLMVMAIRYLDDFTRSDGEWRFASRTLIIDWTDQRRSVEQ